MNGSRLPRPLEAPELARVRGPLAARPHLEALCVFLGETGLRSAELGSLTRQQARNWPAVPWWCRRRACGRHSHVIRIIGKGAGGMDSGGGKERAVVLTPRALRAASRMLASPGRTPALMNFSERWMRDQCQQVGVLAGVHFHPHRLRHTWVQSLVDAGVPIDVVADMAGHETTATTRHYYLLSSRTKVAAMRRRGRARLRRRARVL